MSAILVAMVLAGSPLGDPIVSPSEQSPKVVRTEQAPSPLRQAQDLRRRTSTLLRREATTKDAENVAAIHELLDLFSELVADTSLTRDERNRLRGKVRIRLQAVAKRIEGQIEREQVLARREGRKPENVQLPQGFGEVLGQQINNFGQAAARGPAGDHAGEALVEMIKATIAPGTWEDVGGPGVIRLYPPLGSIRERVAPWLGAIGGAAQPDHGPELVELIQTVIAPESWDVNGGPGTIVYWRNLRVLVVRQTSEVHDNLGDNLEQLRRAGN